jgi:hypothetical protein
MIKETTLTGTTEEIRARISRMAAFGIRQVAIARGQNVINEFAKNTIESS